MSTVTESIRNYAAVNGVFKRLELRKNLGLNEKEMKNGIDFLIKEGSLRRIGHGILQFNSEIEKTGFDKNDKIWRAMKLSPSFSASEIARLSDSTTSYVYKRFRIYRAEGLIKKAGVRPTYGSGEEKLWRLTPAGKDKAQAPNVEVFNPDPLIMDAVNLNRVVCSGLAMRSRESGKEALRLARLIIERIEKEYGDESR